MDGKTFTKLCKDCKLVDKGFTATDCDLIFAKSKTSAERRITFAQFQNALTMVAQKKGITVDQLKTQICGAGGPQFSGTQADNVKFHDDKSLYTGVYAQGGPTNVDSIQPTASFGQAPGGSGGGGSASKEESKGAATGGSGAKQKSNVVAQSQPAGSLQEVFNGFSAG